MRKPITGYTLFNRIQQFELKDDPHAQPMRVCRFCGRVSTAGRSDLRTCSGSCRQALYRWRRANPLMAAESRNYEE